jgi:glyoxylase-like metal-dependent hydrolase (beta-lactamase superfamily II)
LEKCIRIVSAPLSNTVLADDLSEKQSYIKKNETYMATLGITEGNVGMGYVLLLEDGRFIVVDGGNCNCTGTDAANTWCDHVALIWNTMLELYKKANNDTTEAPANITVAAWYLTHAHSDHYNAFYKMVKLAKDGKDNIAFDVEYVIANLPGANIMPQEYGKDSDGNFTK